MNAFFSFEFFKVDTRTRVDLLIARSIANSNYKHFSGNASCSMKGESNDETFLGV